MRSGYMFMLISCLVLLGFVSSSVYACPEPPPSTYFLDMCIDSVPEIGDETRGGFVEVDDEITLNIDLDRAVMDDGALTLTIEFSGSGRASLYDDDGLITFSGSPLTKTWSNIDDVPSVIYIEGTVASSAWRDITLTATYTETGYLPMSEAVVITVGENPIDPEPMEGPALADNLGTGTIQIENSDVTLPEAIEYSMVADPPANEEVSTVIYTVYDEDEMEVYSQLVKSSTQDMPDDERFTFEWYPETAGIYYIEVHVEYTDESTMTDVYETQINFVPETGQSPVDIPGLEVWLDVDCEDDFIKKDSNGDVAVWYNQVQGSKTKYVKAPSGQRPEFVPNSINGHPVLRFSGNQYMAGSADKEEYNHAMFMVIRVDNDDLGDGEGLLSTLSSSKYYEDYLCLRSNADGDLFVEGYDKVSKETEEVSVLETTATPEVMILSLFVNGNKLHLYKNGVPCDANGDPDNDDQGIDLSDVGGAKALKKVSKYILGRYKHTKLSSGVYSYSTFDLAEFLVYRSGIFTSDELEEENSLSVPYRKVRTPALSHDQRISIEEYLADKYGITLGGNEGSPVLSITYPSNGTSLQASASGTPTTESLKAIFLDANGLPAGETPIFKVIDEDGVIENLGYSTATGSSGEYEVDWNVPENAGVYTILVEARDDGFPRLASSSSAQVTVHKRPISGSNPFPVIELNSETVVPDWVSGVVDINIATLPASGEDTTNVSLDIIRDGRVFETVSANPVNNNENRYKHYWIPGESGIYIIKATVAYSNGETNTAEQMVSVTMPINPNAIESLDLWLAADQGVQSVVDPTISTNEWEYTAPSDINPVYVWKNKALSGCTDLLFKKDKTSMLNPRWIASDPDCGNMPAVEFEGVEQIGTCQPGNGYANTTVFLVAKFDEYSNGNMFATGTGKYSYKIGTDADGYLNLQESANKFYIDEKISSGIVSGYNIVCVDIAADKAWYYINGVPMKDGQQDLGEQGANLTNVFGCEQIKKYYLGAMPGRIAEILVFKGDFFTATEIKTAQNENPKSDGYDLVSTPVLDDETRSSIFAYLSSKYEIGLDTGGYNHAPTVSIISPVSGSLMKCDSGESTSEITVTAVAHDSNDSSVLSPLPSLEARWSFDDGMNTTSSDTSGYDRDITLPSSDSWVDGADTQSGVNLGAGYELAGTESIGIPDAAVASIRGNAARTICGRFYWAASQDNSSNALLVFGDSTDYLKIYAGRTCFKVEAKTVGGGTVTVKKDIVTEITDGWNHFAVTYDGTDTSALKIYINGDIITTTHIGTVASLNTDYSGTGCVIGGGHVGAIDDIRIYSEELSANEVELTEAHADGYYWPAFYVKENCSTGIAVRIDDSSNVTSLGNGKFSIGTDLAPGSYIIYAKAIDNQPVIKSALSQEVDLLICYGQAVSGSSDDDGLANEIPDWWELAYFGTLSHTADDDADGDGQSNYTEYLARTDPTVNEGASPIPGIESIWPPSGSTVAAPLGGMPLSMSILLTGTPSTVSLHDSYGNNLTDACDLFSLGLEYSIELSRACLILDGTGDSVDIGTDVSIAQAADFTVCGWVRLEDDFSTPSEDVVFTGTGDNGKIIKIGFVGGKLQLSSDSTVQVVATNEVQSKSWVHFAMAREDGLFTLFYNGHQILTDTSLQWDKDITIASIGDSFKGFITDIQVYSSALGASEIQTVMSGNLLSAGAQAHWLLAENADDTSVSGSHGGTLQGDAAFVDSTYITGDHLAYTLTVDGREFELFFAVDQTLPYVTATPIGGMSQGGTVTLEASEEGASIYYTLDGTYPLVNDASYLYTSPISLTRSATGSQVLRYIAVDVAGNIGPVGKQVYFYSNKEELPVEGVNASYSSPNVVVSWTARAADFDKYHVFKASSVSQLKILEEAKLGEYFPPDYMRLTDEAGISTATYSDTGVLLGITAWYAVIGESSTNNMSALSEIAEISLPGGSPSTVAESVELAQYWLLNSQESNGNWPGCSPAATIRNTSQALKSLCKSNTDFKNTYRSTLIEGGMYLRGVWPGNNADLAMLIHALSCSDANIEGIASRLLLRSYVDGSDIVGWGYGSRYERDPWHSALAIKALSELHSLDDAVDALGWTTGTSLMEARRPSLDTTGYGESGASPRFGLGVNGRYNVSVSALVYSVLGKIDEDTCWDWITDLQDSSNGDINDSVMDTAMVLICSADSSLNRATAKQYLISEQDGNGSWNNDPYVTGLCLEALLSAD